MTLEDKIGQALNLLRGLAQDHGPANCLAAWTGGKDSTLALALWRRCLDEMDHPGPARCISLDTGLKFPEVVEFRDQLAREWGLDLLVARPKVDIDSYPVARDKAECCRLLKVEPLALALRQTGAAALITGIRADEHSSRAGRPALESMDEERGGFPAHVRANPLLDFTEMDVWAATMDLGLPSCSLYAEGYRSLGCMPCTRLPGAAGDERSGRDQDKEAVLSSLHSLGYF